MRCIRFVSPNGAAAPSLDFHPDLTRLLQTAAAKVTTAWRTGPSMGAGRLGMFCQVRRRASWPSHPPMTLVLDARQRHSENFREVVTLCSLCIEFSLKAGEPQLPPEMAKAVGEATRHDAPSTLAPLEAGFFGGPVQDHAERGPSEDCKTRLRVESQCRFRSFPQRCVGIPVRS